MRFAIEMNKSLAQLKLVVILKASLKVKSPRPLKEFAHKTAVLQSSERKSKENNAQ